MSCFAILARRRILDLPLRIYLTIRKRTDGFAQHEPGTPDRFLQLKTAVMLFFSLSVLIGVLIAAFALGSLVAIILTLTAALLVIGSLIGVLFRKLAKIGKRPLSKHSPPRSLAARL
jgi:VIT1/CCC1 family predicted Fe2+/Mn2+ transporter